MTSKSPYTVVVIPVDPAEPIARHTINREGQTEGLRQLQSLVKTSPDGRGYLEALPFPNTGKLTCLINEEGKYECLYEDGRVEVNARATLLMAPVLWARDFIAGPMIVSGFNARNGESLSVDTDLLAKLAGELGVESEVLGRTALYQRLIEAVNAP
jgi:hypothetical protein